MPTFQKNILPVYLGGGCEASEQNAQLA